MKKITFLFVLLITSLGFSQTELVTNGDFETALGTPPEWTGNGDGLNLVDDGTGNFVNEALVGAAAEVWQTNLQQLITLTQDESYDVSFDASIDSGTASIIAGIGENAGDFLNSSETVALTTTLTTFTYTLDANWANVGVNGSRVFFDMGGVDKNGRTITIDNVSVQVAAVAGVEDSQLIEFDTYPNPTRDSWTIKTKSKEMISVQVFDVLGKSVLSILPNSSKITVNGYSLKSGLYFARIQTAEGNSTVKLIKK